MRFLDLCAGIGGFSLGLERAGMTCVGQVEVDSSCTKVLERHWPNVPRWRDVKDGRIIDELPSVDVVCGGYPCQPFSYAGQRRGSADDRHLWPYVFRIVQRLRPTWCLFENVVGHITLGLDMVLVEMESAGYTAIPLVIPAVAVGAPHRRDRVWILAHLDCARQSEPWSYGRPEHTEARAAWENVESLYVHEWPAEPGMVRVAHGLPRQVDRVRSLGNAVIPEIVERIGRAMLTAHYLHGFYSPDSSKP